MLYNVLIILINISFIILQFICLFSDRLGRFCTSLDGSLSVSGSLPAS